MSIETLQAQGWEILGSFKEKGIRWFEVLAKEKGTCQKKVVLPSDRHLQFGSLDVVSSILDDCESHGSQPLGFLHVNR